MCSTITANLKTAKKEENTIFISLAIEIFKCIVAFKYSLQNGCHEIIKYYAEKINKSSCQITYEYKSIQGQIYKRITIPSTSDSIG